jgi:hypothetical protein
MKQARGKTHLARAVQVLLTLFLLCEIPSSAQQISNQSTKLELETLCQYMNASRVQVVLYAPMLESAKLANCLHQATLNYKRKVIVLTVPFFSRAENSYINGLAMADVPIFEANVNSTQGILLIDGVGFQADHLGLTDNPTLERMSAAQTRSAAQWFNQVLPKAKRITFLVAFRRIRGTQ